MITRLAAIALLCAGMLCAQLPKTSTSASDPTPAITETSTQVVVTGKPLVTGTTVLTPTGAGEGFWLMPTFTNGAGTIMRVATSHDGKDWKIGLGAYVDAVRAADQSTILYNNVFYVAQTNGSETGTFNILSSSDGFNYSLLATVSTGLGAVNVYAPEWVRNSDGTPWVDGGGYLHLQFTSDASGIYKIYDTAATSAALTAWAAPSVAFTIAANSLIDPFTIYDSGTFYLWYANVTDVSHTYLEYATSTSEASGYTRIESGNWADFGDGTGTGWEGPALVKIGTTWRLYADQVPSASAGIHWAESTDNFATWTALTAITTDSSFIADHATPVWVPAATGKVATFTNLPNRGGCFVAQVGGSLFCGPLYRDSVSSGTDFLGLRAGTRPQEYRVYRSWVANNNAEWGAITWSGTELLIGRFNASGVAGDVRIKASGNVNLWLESNAKSVKVWSGNLYAATGGTLVGFLQSVAQTADPTCAAVGDIGKIWFDNTSTTTVTKHCVNVAGTLTWKAVTYAP